MNSEICLTRVRKHGGALLSKRITLGEDGRPVSDGSPCAMGRGTADRVLLNGSPAANLADVILGLGSHEALVLGEIADGLPDQIRIEKDANASIERGTVGRTRKTFVYRPGRPAPALLDYDQKAMPAEVRERIENAGGFEGAIATLIPGYEGLARVVRASTSAGIFNRDTGERFPGSGGLHVYVFAADGSDVPGFLDRLVKRAWLAGFGWIMVGARGQMLVRSIVDASVGLPERLSFEGPPEVVSPLAQDHEARQPIAHEGDLLDTRAACPPLSAAELRRFEELVAAAKRAAKPEADAAVERAAETIAAERQIDVAEARKVVESSFGGLLSSHHALEFDDDPVGVVSVADVLADPGRFHGLTLADPIEGRSYGRGKAKVYWNANGSLVIHSFAHGGAIYRLEHVAAYIEARVTAAGKDAPFTLASLSPHARLDAVTEEHLRNLAAKLAKVSRRAVKATITEAVHKARKTAIEASMGRREREREEEAEADEGPGPREDSAPDAEQADEEDDWEVRLAKAVAELNKVYFVARLGGSVRVVCLVYDETLKRERVVLMRDSDLRLHFSHRQYKVGETAKGEDKIRGLGEAWLKDHRRRTYDRMELIPSGRCPSNVYNLWRGFGVEPKAGSWALIEVHLREVICAGHEANYEWLICWLAYAVQNPGRRAEVAVVLRGLKGTGKGMIGQLLIRIFRGHAVHIAQTKHLVGHFNAHLLDALFLFADEVIWGGDKQADAVLKSLVTESTLMIEPKGVDSFPMPNMLKILMATNNDWAVPASADERRYFVLDVPDYRKGDADYFNALNAAIEGDEAAAFLDHLLTLDLSGFDHRNPPHTAGLNRQKLVGGDSFQKFWADCLTTGTIVGAEAVVEGWPVHILPAVLHAAYVEHAHDHGDRHPLSIYQIGRKLRELSPGVYIRMFRPRTATQTKRGDEHYQLSSLEGHRHAFLKAMNIEHYDWSLGDVSDEEDQGDGITGRAA